MTLPNIIELFTSVKYADDINLAISTLLIVIGVKLTQFLPDYIADKYIRKQIKVDIKQIYQDEHSPASDFSEFNSDKLVETNITKVDAIVVGAGPIGLSSALLLQQHGVFVILMEKHPSTSFHPKARGISCRSMELFRRLGVADDIQKHGLPTSQTWFGWFARLSGKLYARVTASTEYAAISPAQTSSVSQIYVEQALLEKFTANGGQVLFNHEVIELAQNKELAQLTALDRKTQQQSHYHAQYVIAADGVRSTLRQQVGIPMLGPAELSKNISIFCEVDLDGIIDKDKRADLSYIFRKGEPSPLVITVDGDKKWIFMFPSAGSDLETLEKIYTEEYIKTRIHDVIGTNKPEIKILSTNIWSLGSQIANQFTAGRVLFAGDSLHQFSPTGGMGMNTGLDDACNLMWKIAHVIQQKAHPRILESYQQERLPIILNNMDWSLKNLHRIISIQRELATKDLDKVNLQPIIQKQEAHLNKSGLDLGVIYESELVMQSDDTKPTIYADNYQPTTFPGARLPHFEIQSKDTKISSLDLVSTDFILLHTQQATNDAEGINFHGVTTQLICINNDYTLCESVPGTFTELTGLNDHGALWVRPDGHIAWRGELNNDSDVAKLNELLTFIGLGQA